MMGCKGFTDADAEASIYLLANQPETRGREATRMDAIFTFLFGTRAGLAVLFFGGIAIIAVVAFVLEKRTSKIYVDRGPASEDDDWTL